VASANDTQPALPPVPLSEIALTGIYEISKILTAANRIEQTLSNVLNVLASFLQMQHGIISLLDDDGVPDVVVGAGWSEGQDLGLLARVPQKAIDQIVATGVPLVVANVRNHPLFERIDLGGHQAQDGVTVSFIGVPIRNGAKVVGTLTIDRAWDGRSIFRFDVDVRFLTMVANLIGQTVQLHRVLARDRDRLIAESHRLQKELSALQPSRARPQSRAGGLIGESAEIRDLLTKIAIVAKSQSPVLLRGESGTGKELIAKAIHELSTRDKGPFIKVNCAALPESVLESELFGHEKGAFTGAINARKGRFELADKGTLFLDEIGEISASFQAKLLRVLQEHEFERVGGSRTIKVDVRVVAATNKNLEEAVTRNEFRADLYYRINVLPLLVPPLRDRPGDIPLLAAAFLDRFNKENGRSLVFGPGSLDVLSACYFPGNVRELENCVCRAATLAPGAVLTVDDFACRSDQCLSAILWKRHCNAPAADMPDRWRQASVGSEHPAVIRESRRPPEAEMPDFAAGPASAVDRDRLVDAMERSGWVQAKAARILGLTPRQIGYALKKNNIPIKRF
jgi:Nif-specific regulatory protein